MITGHIFVMVFTCFSSCYCHSVSHLCLLIDAFVFYTLLILSFYIQLLMLIQIFIIYFILLFFILNNLGKIYVSYQCTCVCILLKYLYTYSS
jgi:hypothetical protein